MKEHEIFHEATAKLQELTGGEILELAGEYTQTGRQYDGLIDLNLGKRKETFIIEIKNELRNNTLPAIKNIAAAADKAFLLICQYIPLPIKKELKDLKINYLEVAGNCFIETEKLFIFINDQQVTATRLPVEGKLWKAAGLKFLFAILRYPELLNRPYRQVANEAGIALGNVGGYLEELRKEGFLRKGIINNEKADFIENKTRLIQRWVEAYRNNLRPKEWVGKFRFMNPEDLKNWRNIQPDGFKWGGENAAALMTGYLHPEKFTLYIKQSRLPLIRQLKLVPDPNGNVELLEQFWPDKEQPEAAPGLVPPLLVYADLATNYDSRNTETAERVKQNYLD
ncbi:type IV toxin-antitoxin system AbiEi family antitoxin [Mucilaginibacter agri]|uniref:Transcriptional regulator n=1 Tax=Mucilaginibacter agri TaxID=2695265 RepID=A0A965ZEF2_9SPHI|nr:type IV toxin-antitoxin system AbiEi family antitoxin [Mucilaginibacter agri]NCD68251.1 hypothetical protein [Mucilaginibacter agri]